MEIRQEDKEIITNAYQVLGDSYRNMNCLSIFLNEEYPERSELKDLILFMGLIRKQELENKLHLNLEYPVFGKECEMLSKEEFKDMLLCAYDINYYGYLDYSEEPNGECVNSDISLYKHTCE